MLLNGLEVISHLLIAERVITQVINGLLFVLENKVSLFHKLAPLFKLIGISLFMKPWLFGSVFFDTLCFRAVNVKKKKRLVVVLFRLCLLT